MTTDNGSIKCGYLDTNFFDDLQSSNSLCKEENEKIKLNNATFESTPSSGQFLSFNAQSLFNKMGELECLVNSMNPVPLFISVTETWCLEKDTDSFYQLPNYQILRRDRTQRQGVCYCTFIHRQQQKFLVCILWKRQTKTSG